MPRRLWEAEVYANAARWLAALRGLFAGGVVVIVRGLWTPGPIESPWAPPEVRPDVSRLEWVAATYFVLWIVLSVRPRFTRTFVGGAETLIIAAAFWSLTEGACLDRLLVIVPFLLQAAFVLGSLARTARVRVFDSCFVGVPYPPIWMDGPKGGGTFPQFIAGGVVFVSSLYAIALMGVLAFAVSFRWLG